MTTDKENLKHIFDQMQKNGFDLNEPLKWGFFFFDKNKEKIENVFMELKEHNYILNSIEIMEDNLWRLFVTKTEVLTVEKLHKRNIAFNELAQYYDIQLYDGWDVEKA